MRQARARHLEPFSWLIWKKKRKKKDSKKMGSHN